MDARVKPAHDDLLPIADFSRLMRLTPMQQSVRSGPARIVSQLTCAIATPDQPATSIAAQAGNADVALVSGESSAHGIKTPAEHHCFFAGSSSLLARARAGFGGAGVMGAER
jgi:hypothetical protein